MLSCSTATRRATSSGELAPLTLISVLDSSETAPPAEAIAAVLIPLGLPVDILCSAEDYAAAIGLDKKGAGADLTLILLEKLGRAVPHKLPKAELLRLL